MTDQPDLFLDYDAAYVMGALDPPDRRAFEEHLRGCPRCAAGVSELAGMPGLLAQVPVDQVLSPRPVLEPPPDTLLPRLAGEVRRRRRRRVWGGVVAAAAACLVAAVVLTNIRTSPEPASEVLVMSAVKSVPVTASVQLDPVSWGTRVNLECTYAESTSETGWGPRVYRLVVVPRDGGAVQQVAQWSVLPGRTVTPVGSTDLTTDEIQDIRLLNARGETLLHVSPSV